MSVVLVGHVVLLPVICALQGRLPKQHFSRLKSQAVDGKQTIAQILLLHRHDIHVKNMAVWYKQISTSSVFHPDIQKFLSANCISSLAMSKLKY
jgi:hypothetical protein